jgi:hypothetical protein
MEVRELFATLGLDLDETSFAIGELAAQGVTEAMKLMGEAAKWVGEQLIDLVAGTAEAADKIDEAAQRAGVNAEQLQRLAYAASFSSISMDELAHTMGLLSRNGQAAIEGSEEMAKAFNKVGLSAAELRSMSVEQQMEAIADRFKAMPEGAEKTALAMQLFGRSGAAMLPFLNAGAEAIRKAGDEGQRFGLVLDKETIEAGVRFSDNLDRVKGSLEGLKYTIGGPLLGVVGEYLGKLAEWIADHRELVDKGIKVLVKNLWILKGVVGSLTTYLVLRTLPSLVALEGAELAWGAAALISGARALAAGAMAAAGSALAMVGWLALAALIFLVGEDVYQFFQGNDSVLGKYGEKWTHFLDELYRPRKEDGGLVSFLKAVGAALADLEGTAERVVKWMRELQILVYSNGQTSTFNPLAYFVPKSDEQTAADMERIKREGRSPSERANGLYPNLAQYDDPKVRAMESTFPGGSPQLAYRYFGGGASPLASAQSAASVRQAGPMIGEINQTVQLPAGVDAKQAGDASVDALDRLLRGQYAPVAATQE